VLGITTATTTGLTLAQRVAMIASAAATQIVAVATSVWTGAQWLLNAALTANPIGIVIVLIVALVAAIVIAYNKSATFRAIVQAVGAALVTAFHAVVAAVQVAVAWIVGAWTQVVAAFRAAWASIQAVASTIGAFFTQVWNTITATARVAWNMIVSVVTAVVTRVIVLAKALAAP
jgi:phage-related protein